MNNDNVENTEIAEQAEVVAPIDIQVDIEPEIAEQAVVIESVTVAPKTGNRQPSLPGAAVSGNAFDQVLLSSCVFKNKFARKSLSIHHVQRRLAELGYPDAASDKDGWYGDLTASAVAVFQATEGLESTGVLDMATLNAIFHDDPNVTVGA